MTTQRKLPLTYGWNSGNNGGSDTVLPTPTWQRERIDQDGWPLCPSVELVPWKTWAEIEDHNLPAIAAAAETGRPLLFTGNNVLTFFSYYDEFTGNNDPYEPENHAWLVKDRSSEGLPPETSGQFISWYSPHSTRWAKRLGYLIATSEQVVEIASRLPEPVEVWFFDNNEDGFYTFHSKYRDVREKEIGYNSVGQFREWADSYQPQNDIEEKLLSNYLRRLDQNLNDSQQQWMWLAFNQGFQEGLASHSEHWAEVGGFVAYDAFQEPHITPLTMLDNLGDPTLVDDKQAVIGKPGHRFGITSETYMNPWYGDWNGTRTWGVISNTAFQRKAQVEQYGSRFPRSIGIVWEGKDRPNRPELSRRWPSREEWRAYARCAMWITRAELFGHFFSSTAQTDDPRITVYYDEVNNVAKEVYANPTLAEFWADGELVESIAPTPRMKANILPTEESTHEWYYQHVVEAGRYVSDVESSPKLIDGADADGAKLFLQSQGRQTDLWRKDLTGRAPIQFACWAIKLGERYLVYIARVLNDHTGPVTAKLRIDGSVKDVVFSSVVTGGEFWVYDSATQLLTAVEA